MADTETAAGPAPVSDEAATSTAPAKTSETDALPDKTEEAGTSEDEAPAPETEAEKPPPNPRVREIIALRKRAQEAEARAAEFERRLSQPRQDQALPQIDLSAFLPPPPDPAKFPAGEFDEAYRLAREEWAIQRYEAKREMQSRAAAQHAERERLRRRDDEIQTRAAERLEEASERIPDLRKHVAVLTRLPEAAGDVLTIALAESEHAPEIVRHLATNEADRSRLAGMSHAQAALFIGRLEERMERSRAASSATNAPPPPRTVTGKGKPTTDLYDPDLPMDEFAKRWQRRYYAR